MPVVADDLRLTHKLQPSLTFVTFLSLLADHDAYHASPNGYKDVGIVVVAAAATVHKNNHYTRIYSSSTAIHHHIHCTNGGSARDNNNTFFLVPENQHKQPFWSSNNDKNPSIIDITFVVIYHYY